MAHPGKVWDWYMTCKPHTIYVHIKDGLPPDAAGEHYTWPGEGKGMVREVIADLLKTGYDGGFSIEPHLGHQIHKGGAAEKCANSYEMYLEYARRFMKIVEAAKK